MIFKAKYFDELTCRELYEIIKARTEIFLLEQNIICQDLDDVDYKSLHCFLEDDGKVLAYLRAFYSDEEEDTVKIGRVLSIEHKKGLGRKIMEEGLRSVEEKMTFKKLSMNAQVYATGFYEKFGFNVCSEEFLEENVLHVVMEKLLTKNVI